MTKGVQEDACWALNHAFISAITLITREYSG